MTVPIEEKVKAKLGELKHSGGFTQAIKDGMAAINQKVMLLGQSATGSAPGSEPGSSKVTGQGLLM